MKILILGAKGLLGTQLLKEFPEAVGWDRQDIDVAQSEKLKAQVKKFRPSVIINCVAFNDVDGAEANQKAALELNAGLPQNLAAVCGEIGCILVHFSTNYVFDGEKGKYEETDAPNPLSFYGKSKFAGERAVMEAKDYYLIRTAVLFGPKPVGQNSKKTFVELMLELSAKTDTIKAVADEVNSLTYAPDLAQAVKGLLEGKKPYGIYHLTNAGEASWYDFAKEIFEITGKKVNLIPVSSAEFSRKALRPKKAVLLNTKLPQLRPWREALKEFLTSNL